MSDLSSPSGSASISVTRARLALVAGMFAVVGAIAGGVFDQFVWTLVLAPLIPVAAIAATAVRRPALRVGAACVGVLGSLVIAVFVAGGGVGDPATALQSGVRRLLSTEWPSPSRPVLIGAVAVALATGAALSALFATWRRWHLVPLLPVATTYTAVIAMSAPLGVRPLALVLVCSMASLFAALRDDGAGLRDRWLFLRGERRLLIVVGIVAIVAGAVSIPVGFTARADPRVDEPATATSPLLDPVEAARAQRSLDPPVDLHEVTAQDGDAGVAVWPERWRTAALTDYDGRRWTPSLTLRPIGSTLGVATGPTVAAAISFLRDDLSLVPLPGPPVSVDADVETDVARTVVRLADRPDVGAIVDVVSNITPDVATLTNPTTVAREVDESVAGLTGLAQSLGEAGDGTVMGQLRAIEATMREEFVLESEAPAGGLQRVLIDRFLRDTRVGNREQFATAFVLLARSLGVEARVATGFQVEPSPTADALVITSADASIWPEVQLVDGTWVAFDPAPDEESSDETPEPPERPEQAPAAPQPPVAPPPDVGNDTPDADQNVTDEVSSGWSDAQRWAILGSLGAGVLLLPLVLGTTLVLLVKRQRRRRRLRAELPTERIRGAWASATDVLVDAGLEIAPSSTDRQIATSAVTLVPDAQRELHRLATLNGSATFGSPARADLLAQDAAVCLTSIDEAIGAQWTRWRRLRWRLSLRSLRSTTRSPVRA